MVAVAFGTLRLLLELLLSLSAIDGFFILSTRGGGPSTGWGLGGLGATGGGGLMRSGGIVSLGGGGGVAVGPSSSRTALVDTIVVVAVEAGGEATVRASVTMVASGGGSKGMERAGSPSDS